MTDDLMTRSDTAKMMGLTTRGLDHVRKSADWKTYVTENRAGTRPRFSRAQVLAYLRRNRDQGAEL